MRSNWWTDGLRAAAVLAVSIAGSAAQAQTYPSQPIRIIVPTAAGGVADIAGRALAQRLTEIGKIAVVENRTGGGGAIAADYVAKSAPDGYTVYVGFHATQAVLPHLQKLPFDPEKDFAPVTVAVKSANILLVNPVVPARSLPELVAHAKANPGKLTYASPGNGSSGHIVAEQLDILALALPQVQAQKVRALAITSAQPDPLFPGVPTTAQAGFPQLEGGPWFGFFVPAKTPRAVIDWLHAEATQAFSTPESRARFAQQGLTTVLGSPGETSAFVAAEWQRWGDVIRRANIRLE